jgi:hypothetical protein
MGSLALTKTAHFTLIQLSSSSYIQFSDLVLNGNIFTDHPVL